jgi:hypothetical protein
MVYPNPCYKGKYMRLCIAQGTLKLSNSNYVRATPYVVTLDSEGKRVRIPKVHTRAKWVLLNSHGANETARFCILIDYGG